MSDPGPAPDEQPPPTPVLETELTTPLEEDVPVSRSRLEDWAGTLALASLCLAAILGVWVWLSSEIPEEGDRLQQSAWAVKECVIGGLFGLALLLLEHRSTLTGIRADYVPVEEQLRSRLGASVSKRFRNARYSLAAKVAGLIVAALAGAVIWQGERARAAHLEESVREVAKQTREIREQLGAESRRMYRIQLTNVKIDGFQVRGGQRARGNVLRWAHLATDARFVVDGKLLGQLPVFGISEAGQQFVQKQGAAVQVALGSYVAVSVQSGIESLVNFRLVMKFDEPGNPVTLTWTVRVDDLAVGEAVTVEDNGSYAFDWSGANAIADISAKLTVTRLMGAEER